MSCINDQNRLPMSQIQINRQYPFLQNYTSKKKVQLSSASKIGSSCIIYSKKSKNQSSTNKKYIKNQNFQYVQNHSNSNQSQIDLRLSELINDLIDLEQLNTKQTEQIKYQRQKQLMQLHKVLQTKIEQNNKTLQQIKNILQQEQDLSCYKMNKQTKNQNYMNVQNQLQIQRQQSKNTSQIILIDNSWVV